MTKEKKKIDWKPPSRQGVSISGYISPSLRKAFNEKRQRPGIDLDSFKALEYAIADWVNKKGR